MIEQNEGIERLHPDGLTSLSRVADLYDVSAKTIRRRWESESSDFPKPIKIDGCNYFKNRDLLEYNESLQYETA